MATNSKLSAILACTVTAGVFATSAQADYVFNDSLLARDGLCAGSGCTDPETYGDDDLIIKETNNRLLFLDTSTASNYPSADWRLVANDSEDNGANYFALEDVEENRKVFVVEDDAPSNALYVSSSGRIGLGTSLPTKHMHFLSGNEPTIRLEQDATAGFSPQTWELAGNEASFVIRDATNGIRNILKVRPGADADSLVVNGNSNVGVGLASASASLHVYRDDGTAQVRVQETSNIRTAREMLRFENNGGSWITFRDQSNGREWYFTHENNAQGRFFINHSDGGLQMAVTRGGDLSVLGTITAGGTALNVPDYVFADDYDLRPLTEVQAFIDANSHLPDVPSAAEIKAGGLDMTNMQMALLKKVEELTLYTLEQDALLATQRAETETLHAQVQQLTALVSQMSAEQPVAERLTE
ncbi:hypothetical protein [Pacificoceanicola onchidii]|uniref:hypothetical protein n=1 Tax=Pacificoceanicola onchidii TaxID=2562685 RepID=UPI0010A3B5B9|nr:hypothetical protein [Pacificoceanicola onchidii]